MGRPAGNSRGLVAAGVIFTALGDETRLRILARLSDEGPLSIVRLSGVADVSRQAITKHLHALEAAGLVESRRTGRERIWELKPRPLGEVRRYLEEISGHWDKSIGRLRSLVEE